MSILRFSQQYERYRNAIELRLALLSKKRAPASVYEPVRYVLASGGKRVRAVLVLLGCEAVGGKASQALDAAAAIELLHNFTLIHDDVMDHAPLRRGRATIHTKWDGNIAILSGDQMAGMAYDALLRTKSARLPEACAVLTDAFMQVCEGQAYDKEFECRDTVTRDEYMMMIGTKTGRVISAAAELGGIIGGGNRRQAAALRKFGEYLGRAFQIQDDLLDIAGSEKTLGKVIGGDITEGKKTYWLVEALGRTDGSDRRLLLSIKPNGGLNRATIRRVREIYQQCGALEAARDAIRVETQRAEKALSSLPSTRARAMLAWLSGQLLGRQS